MITRQENIHLVVLQPSPQKQTVETELDETMSTIAMAQNYGTPDYSQESFNCCYNGDTDKQKLIEEKDIKFTQETNFDDIDYFEAFVRY